MSEEKYGSNTRCPNCNYVQEWSPTAEGEIKCNNCDILYNENGKILKVPEILPESTLEKISSGKKVESFLDGNINFSE